MDAAFGGDQALDGSPGTGCPRAAKEMLPTCVNYLKSDPRASTPKRAELSNVATTLRMARQAGGADSFRPKRHARRAVSGLTEEVTTDPGVRSRRLGARELRQTGTGVAPAHVCPRGASC